MIMTHSTRMSYKDKYLAAKADVELSESNAELLTEFSRFQEIAELKRAEQHAILQEVADAANILSEMLDSKVGQLGFKIKDVRKPIDVNLSSMDAKLIARRTRDLIKHATTRIGIAGLGVSELRDSVTQLSLGVTMLEPAMRRAQRGYTESYVVGRSPTDRELEEARDHEGKNPRTLDYEYETDDSDSEPESEDKKALAVVQSPALRLSKPTGRTPASRRVKPDANAIDIS